MFALGVVRDGILFVVGLYWCKAMSRRWRRDLEELCESRNIRDWCVIAALWGVTAFVLVCLIVTSVGVVRSVAHLAVRGSA
jgi:hypothetical protein